jgi:hypothetical protein
LGLNEGCYLSLVKFLASSILREVWVNIFCFLNFLFVFFGVHWH